MSDKHKSNDGGKSWSLWLWVIFAFALLISGWTTIILISNYNKPELVEKQDH
ncbi:MAG: hypothetical protein AB3N63_15000 [Puniceicoccaceae bacterium]